MIHVALFHAIYLGQVIEGFIGQFDVRHPFENASENVPRLVPVVTPGRQNASHEIGPDCHTAVPTVGKALEDLLRFLVVLLGHEGLTDPEFRLNRLVGVGIGILHRHEFTPRHVEARPLEVVATEEELNRGLFGDLEIFGLGVFHKPPSKDILGSLMILVTSGRDVILACEKYQLERDLFPVTVEQALVRQIGFQGQFVVAKTKVENGFHQGG